MRILIFEYFEMYITAQYCNVWHIINDICCTLHICGNADALKSSPADWRWGCGGLGAGSLGEIKAESIPYLGNSDSRSIRGQV